MLSRKLVASVAKDDEESRTLFAASCDLPVALVTSRIDDETSDVPAEA